MFFVFLYVKDQTKHTHVGVQLKTVRKMKIRNERKQTAGWCKIRWDSGNTILSSTQVIYQLFI